MLEKLSITFSFQFPGKWLHLAVSCTVLLLGRIGFLFCCIYLYGLHLDLHPSYNIVTIRVEHTVVTVPYIRNNLEDCILVIVLQPIRCELEFILSF